ncbi:hypothetical protein [Lysobacter sp. Root494]|uniref:hypothetical protein n=1 Tax=Lysobacter sp. Root494 TaxID=1736549 RepID=UPI0012F8D992|nr:hypothetical protein [Lysobacter sp. Root494]
MIALSAKHRKACATFLASLFLAGCSTITPVSPYDEPTDKALTELQQSSDDFIVDLIAHASEDANSYGHHQDFYQAADQKLRRLEFRVSSIHANTPTVKLVGDIRSVLLGSGRCDPDGASLRDLHCNSGKAGPTKVALEASRRSINQTIGAALTLELAKKVGD